MKTFPKLIGIFLSLILITFISGCGGGGSDATTTTTTTDPATASTGDVTFTGPGASALPSSDFSAVSFNEVINTPSALIMEWTSSDNTIVAVVLENNIVLQIFVTDQANVWVADSSFVTINATYDGAVVTFTDQTLFEGAGAAGELVMNGSLSR